MNEGRPLRVRIEIAGAVQGVGFRPFIYRLANAMHLTGWVNNTPQGVVIEAEGQRPNLDNFLQRIDREKPVLSTIQQLDHVFMSPVGFRVFEIRRSASNGDKTAYILPDATICPDCLREIFDPTNRRYGYPFTNCTNCGPRFSIIEALPYDRPNTTMRHFEMCESCRAEYEDPLDRRFHAQPNACPQCGPHLELWDGQGNVLASHGDALKEAADAIRRGLVVAVKGLGGFHLMVDARNEHAVMLLRQRKHRSEKPLATMYPSLAMVKEHNAVSALEETLLCSPESPIVLLHKTVSDVLAKSVAPGNPTLGVMLPYTPLHHLLMAELGFPVVATSGNLSDEPICIDEHEALRRLDGIADCFLVHNRPIARHVDDSVVRVVLDKPQVLRRARGYAPRAIHVKATLPPMIATGAHLKNTVAIASGHDVFLSQHIGDLETVQAFEASQRALESLSHLYELNPEGAACDMHPDYLSTETALSSGLPTTRVQHHYAHVLACMAEHNLEAPLLGVSWDGTGYGLDGTIWGGEFLRVSGGSFERVGHLRTFRLPGGEKAVREPRRCGIGLLYEAFGAQGLTHDELVPIQTFTCKERELLLNTLAHQINAPVTSSAGRLFDAIAAIVGLRQLANFEGQAAMELEFAVAGAEGVYPFAVEPEGLVVDWAPMLQGILDDVHCGTPVGHIAAKFHHTLAEMIVEVARRVGEERVVLTGGCFQNTYLLTQTVTRLQAEHFQVYWPQCIPPNDGGIALGQVMAAVQGKE